MANVLCDEIVRGEITAGEKEEDVLVLCLAGSLGFHQFHAALQPWNSDILGIEILAAAASLVTSHG